MVIKTQLTEKDFVNISFLLLLSKRVIKVWFIILMFIPLFIILAAIGIIPVKVEYSQAFIYVITFVLIVYAMYKGAQKNYRGNARISEPITYTIEKGLLTITGESFNSQLTWEKLYKVSLTKNWLLLWNTSANANPIPRRNISVQELAELKSILDLHKVKNNL